MLEREQKMKKEMEEKFEARLEKMANEIHELHKKLENFRKEMHQRVLSPQQSPSLVKNNNINRPSWIVSEQTCIEIYNKSNKQIVQFLNDFLPKLCNIHEVFLDKIPHHHFKELDAVIKHFWDTFPENFDLARELRKERLSQRFLLTEELKERLKSCDGLIISENGEMYECRWSHSRNMFLPKIADYTETKNSFWQYPTVLKDDTLFLAVSKRDMKLYAVTIPSGAQNLLRILH
jgi:hypothetical protein